MVTSSCKKDINNTIEHIPELSTNSLNNITSNSATCEGNITIDGGASISSRGLCWSTHSNPTISDNKTSEGTGTGTFISSLTGLIANTTYYVRAYATNSSGTAYGNEISFKTTLTGYGTITDVDGNVYHVVTIGTQVWMVENLKTTKYRNGDPIPNVSDGTVWSDLKTGAYCNYDNNANNSIASGRLYNWYAANDDRIIAPLGWHVPSDAEWTILTTYLGGENVAGGKLKEIGTTHWQSPNTDATNESGFTAIQGGYLDRSGIFNEFETKCFWWSSTTFYDNYNEYAWIRHLSYYNARITKSYMYNSMGCSIRCVRDY